MVPTPRLWLLVAIGIPFGMLVGVLDAPYLLLVYNLLLLGLVLVTSKLVPATQLGLSRRFDPVLSVRTRNKVQVDVTNDSGIDVEVRLRDEPPAWCEAEGNEQFLKLASGSEGTFEYWVTPTERGSDFFRGTFARFKCPLGLVEREVKLTTQQPVRIYPNVLALREFNLLNQKGRLNQIGIRQSRVRGLGTEFESLREYSDGDDFRKVDWKATARRGKLIVRQFEQERSQAVILAVDIGRLMMADTDGATKLDHTLDSLLMLAQAAVVAGDSVGLLVYSDIVHRYVPPRRGRNHLGILIEAIHDLVAEPVESNPVAAFAYLSTKWKRRSLLVLFTDATDEADGKALVTALGSQARRNLTLVARVADPRLRELCNLKIGNRDDLFARAAGLLVTEERDKVPTALSLAHIRNLEAEPQDLAAALVSFYLQVKEKSLL